MSSSERAGKGVRVEQAERNFPTAEQLAEKGQFGAAVNALASDPAAQKAVAPSPAPAFVPAAGQAPQASTRTVSSGAPAPSSVGRADAASTAAVTFTSTNATAPR